MTVIAFEKWQALGNDYLVLEEDRLPAPLTADQVRALCHRHFGVGADGVLLLARTSDAGFVADLRIFNPDGSEAELSGNGAREAIMYLHRHGWTDRRQFSIRTVAGEIRPTILDETRCRVDMGRAKLHSAKDFPSGGPDGRGELAGRTFQFVSIGNPQCAIAVEDPDALDLGAIGPDIEHSPLFPNRTNVSFYAPLDEHAIRARIFERGVGETLSSGTGATGAAVAHVLRGGSSPVTVRLDGGELEVEVEDDLHVNLTGWALPVFRGEIDLP
ncbi:diaminopimelate epimerase [Capillimicrobium parvum]|uniref:Diaminopimelate epimerase n=1 Tax=Capillimicrobium parvum TaxID=2884022 RepID=A0A9E7C0R6_9ACTN|nr:diaminopimelate epimerase [Capillimicrobium parvum]UGS36661.1 Diaminopimelate epimerase [Capillimicrobium parvum]